MNADTETRTEAHWAEDDKAWRNPEDVVAGWQRSDPLDHRLLDATVSGDWWAVLDRLDACVIVSREYEHLLLALTVAPEGPRQSFMSLPHPSGLAFDARPNDSTSPARATQTSSLSWRQRDGMEHEWNGATPLGDRPLAPLSATFLPGRLYLHDLALIASPVRQRGGPECRRALGGAGRARSCLVAPRSRARRATRTCHATTFSSTRSQLGRTCPHLSFQPPPTNLLRRLPGHRNFPVDRRGVIFSGAHARAGRARTYAASLCTSAWRRALGR